MRKKNVHLSYTYLVQIFAFTCMHVLANWIELPPTPQNPSTIISPLQRSAKCSAIFSGVTEYQDSSDSILIPSSYLEKRRYRWCQYFLDSAYGKSAVVRMSVVVISLSCFTDEVSDIDLKKHLLGNFEIQKKIFKKCRLPAFRHIHTESVLNWVTNSVVFLIFFLAKKGE